MSVNYNYFQLSLRHCIISTIQLFVNNKLTYLLMFCIQSGGGTIGKHLVRIDPKYAALFNDAVWKEMFADKMESSLRFGWFTDHFKLRSANFCCLI